MTAELTQTPMTKERLARYISLRRENENQLERLARMRNEEKIPAIRESDGSQHTSGGSDRMANAIIRRMEYEERVMPQIDGNLKEMEYIEGAINSLPDPMEREVLRLRYIDGSTWRHLPWGEVALRLYGDNDERCMKATFRLYQKAISSIESMGR